MASSSFSPFPPSYHCCAQTHVPFRCSSLSFFFPVPTSSPHRLLALRAASGSQGGAVESHGGVQDPSVLRRSSISVDTHGDNSENGNALGLSRDELDAGDGVPGEGELDERVRKGQRKKRRDGAWVDWEDQILGDTVPLVGFVRMILHSGKYESGDRLSPEHQELILERLLVHHPQYEQKIGCGIDYITIGYHPDFEGSRCMFIVRKDGELVDFSYWKCLKSLIRKKYPLYADSFILRHFRRRRNPE